MMRWLWTTRRNFDQAMDLVRQATGIAQHLIGENDRLRTELQKQTSLAGRLVETINAADTEFLRQVGAKVE
jgi:hypothetical protein